MQGAQGCTPSPAYMMEILIEGRGPANGWMPRPEIYVIRTIPVYLKNGPDYQLTWRSAVFPAYLANQVLAANRERERAVVTRGLRKHLIYFSVARLQPRAVAHR